MPDSRGLGAGIALSFLGFFPIGYLDFNLAYDNSAGGWALMALFLPYVIYFGIGSLAAMTGERRLGKGIVIGGAIFSTLIIVGILLVAFFFSVMADA
jgi:hypothetical protein